LGNDTDFIIKVDGEDITKDIMKWKLHEVDDGTSSITLLVANPNMKHSGQFAFSAEVDIMFGKEGLTEHIYGMEVTSITEDYALGRPTIALKAEDATRYLEEGSAQGMFPKGTKVKDAVNHILKIAGLQADIRKLEEAEFDRRMKLPLGPGFSFGEQLSFYARLFRMQQ